MYYVKMADGEEERVLKREMFSILEYPQHVDKKILKAALRIFKYYSTPEDKDNFKNSDTYANLKRFL